jgi:hypothetical protein
LPTIAGFGKGLLTAGALLPLGAQVLSAVHSRVVGGVPIGIFEAVLPYPSYFRDRENQLDLRFTPCIEGAVALSTRLESEPE